MCQLTEYCNVSINCTTFGQTIRQNKDFDYLSNPPLLFMPFLFHCIKTWYNLFFFPFATHLKGQIFPKFTTALLPLSHVQSLCATATLLPFPSWSPCAAIVIGTSITFHHCLLATSHLLLFSPQALLPFYCAIDASFLLPQREHPHHQSLSAFILFPFLIASWATTTV